MNKQIPIFYACDDAFVKYTIVSLTSIKANASLDRKYHVYVLYTDISDEMKENIDKYYGGDVYAYCEDYYSLLCDVVNKTKCNIVAHFDLITKFNEKMPLIDEEHPRYKSAVNKAISALKDSGAYFEVNVGAITRGYRTKAYPSEYIMEQLMSNGKPFVLSSDTHCTFTLDMHLDAYARVFDKLGIKYITSLDEIL